MPTDYAKWAETIVNYVLKIICITLAWFAHRFLSCIHSAIRGGTMLSRNLFQYLHVMNYVQINPDETVLDEIAGAALAALGIYFQLSIGYVMPFPLNIILSPVLIAEYFLIFFVSSQ